MSIKQRFGALKNLPPFFKLIWDTNPRIATVNVIFRIIKSVIPVVMLYIGKLIIDEVVYLTSAEGDGDLTEIFTFIGIEFALAIFSDLLNRSIALLDSLLGDLFANKTSVKLMQHASDLDLDQFEDADFYDKLERARRQTVARTALMSQVLGQLQNLITIISLGIGLVVFNPWLILILVITVIPAFLGENYFNERSYSLIFSWTPQRRELDYLRYTGASDETAKEVKIFGLADFLIKRFKRLSDQYYEENKKLSIKRAGWGLLFAAIGSAGYYSAYVYIVYQTAIGQLTIGDLTFLSGSFMRLRALLEGLITQLSTIAEGSLYLKDFFEFFELKPRIKRNKQALPFPSPIQKGFEFQDVGFKYQNSEKWAVRNVNFTLQAGEKLALVGENGAGKTTLVKLLSRLYDPTEGRILLDGKDLREYDPEDLRKETGVIFQDFVKYQMKAKENIAVGRIDELEDTDRIEDSAKQSLADKVVEGLPDRYEQMIGKRFANGVDLSGGQWQKIALGRAYMRDAQLLILDEPTAALDARAEHDVFVRFTELTNNKTAVLISHRFSTVRMADRILVLEGGKVLESGSHEELLEDGGKYAELFSLQAEGYK
ncbi:MAG: ABC transporter ATP-binding protein [Bacteroidota bacterium]